MGHANIFSRPRPRSRCSPGPPGCPGHPADIRSWSWSSSAVSSLILLKSRLIVFSVLSPPVLGLAVVDGILDLLLAEKELIVPVIHVVIRRSETIVQMRIDLRLLSGLLHTGHGTLSLLLITKNAADSTASPDPEASSAPSPDSVWHSEADTGHIP